MPPAARGRSIARVGPGPDRIAIVIAPVPVSRRGGARGGRRRGRARGHGERAGDGERDRTRRIPIGARPGDRSASPTKNRRPEAIPGGGASSIASDRSGQAAEVRVQPRTVQAAPAWRSLQRKRSDRRPFRWKPASISAERRVMVGVPRKSHSAAPPVGR